MVGGEAINGKAPEFGGLWLFTGVWQKSHNPGPFNSGSQLALVMGTVSGDSPGKNFASLSNIASQAWNLFIIYVLDFVGAEVALTSLFAAFLFNHQLSLLRKEFRHPPCCPRSLYRPG